MATFRRRDSGSATAAADVLLMIKSTMLDHDVGGGQLLLQGPMIVCIIDIFQSSDPIWTEVFNFMNGVIQAQIYFTVDYNIWFFFSL